MSRVQLDGAQRRAVEHGAGPCLVLAGPGSGKTRVIVERFLRLTGQGVPAERQLVLTYTRKAAEEMRERVEAEHGPFHGEPPLTNYHSFAQRVLRQWGWLVGISPAFRIADDAERWLHADALLAELRPATLYNPLRPHDLVDAVLNVIGQAKQELVTPDAYVTWADAALDGTDDPVRLSELRRHRDCAEVYRHLEERYKRRAVLDHDDTILYAERLLREHPEVRLSVCDALEHVMVDEYQDTNFAQARLVETLVAGHGNILVVADDDQSIYKFRGASLANLDRFERTYPKHVRIVLDTNYRSLHPIVQVSRAVIDAARPESRIEKRLTAARGGGEPVEVWEADDERSEAVAVARECRRLIESGTAPRDIAWLFRRHDDMQSPLRTLREHGVPYVVHGGRGFFQQPEVKDVLALLRAVADPDDSQAVLRCLALPAWGLDKRSRLELAHTARDNEVPLAAAIAAGDAGLGAGAATVAARCVDDLVALHGQSQRDDVRDLLFEALEVSGFLGIVDGPPTPERQQRGANLNKIGELLESFAEWSDDRSLPTALRYLEVLRDSGAADEIPAVEDAGEGVALLTAHSAKGLEWPVVFLARCSDERWPGRPGFTARLVLPDALVPEPAPDGDGHRDEERRLFYVAATRARDRLVLTHARRYRHSWQDERRTQFLDVLESGGGESRSVAVPAVRAPQPQRPAELLGLSPQRVRASVSDLAAFKECPRRYGYRAVYRLPVRDSPQQWYGVMMHSVLQAAATRRRAGELVDPDLVASLWRDVWRDARGPKGANAELRTLGEEQLRRYVASAGWTEAHIEAVEEAFTLAVDDGDITGRFDRIDEDPDGAGATVVDYKTGPPRTEEELRRDLQVRAYAVALSRRLQSHSVAVEMHWLQTGEVTRVPLDRRDLDRAFGHVSGSAREVAEARASREFPARPNRWRCRRCEYRTICDEGRAAAAEGDEA